MNGPWKAELRWHGFKKHLVVAELTPEIALPIFGNPPVRPFVDEDIALIRDEATGEMRAPPLPIDRLVFRLVQYNGHYHTAIYEAM